MDQLITVSLTVVIQKDAPISASLSRLISTWCTAQATVCSRATCQYIACQYAAQHDAQHTALPLCDA